jgi:hypothetical protein
VKRRLLGLGGLFLLSQGCASPQFQDTEGRRYVLDCEKQNCVVRAAPGASNQPITTASYFVQQSGHTLAVCDSEAAPFSCRPVRCDDGALCLRLGGAEFACETGRCIAASRSRSPEDKVTACLAGTGPYKGSAAQAERITLAHACMGSCTLPAACESP